MGISQNRCMIWLLEVGLAFHRIFERMCLNGCIARAGFGLVTVGYMRLMFSAALLLGIVMGMTIFFLTGYHDSSSNELIIQLTFGFSVFMNL